MRRAAAVVLCLLGAAIAFFAAERLPAPAGTAAVSEATPSSAEAYAVKKAPAVWYEEDGLYLYRPDNGSTVLLSELKDCGMDRMTLYYSGKNPAALTTVTAGGDGVYYMKNLTTDYIGITRGDLFYRALPENGEPGGETAVDTQVLSCLVLPDGSPVWLDSNTSLWTLDGAPGTGKPVKIASGIKDYRAARDENRVFLLSELSKAYFYSPETGRKLVAEGVSELNYVSENLDKIYYMTEGKDLFFIGDFGSPRIVDVDVEKTAVIEKTGNAYYLKAERNGTESAGAESAAAEYTGADENTALPPADQTELTPEEEALVSLRIEELLQGITEGTAEGTGTQTETASGQTFRLGYFDGETHASLLEGVTGVDDSRTDAVENDRLIVYTGPKDSYSVWFMMEEKPLYTGLSTSYEGLMDLCPDMTEDVLYVARQREDQFGKPDQGGIYAMRYTEKGFSNPEPLFEGAVIISAAREGRVYAGTWPEDGGATLLIGGKKVAAHVSSFFWDENGVKKDIQIYRNVFRESYYTSGELDRWTEEEGLSPVAYNVREYHGFEDGSFTMLCDYDEDEMTGTLLWWDGEGTPVTLSERAAGTRPGQGELD